MMRIMIDAWRNASHLDSLRRRQIHTLIDAAASFSATRHAQKLIPLSDIKVGGVWIDHQRVGSRKNDTAWSLVKAAFCSVSALEQKPTENFVNFRDITTWEGVLEKVNDLGDKITPDQIGAAFGCLKKIHANQHSVSEGLLADLCSKALRPEKVLNARQITDVLHACGKMKYGNVQLLEHVAGLVVKTKAVSIDSFDARNLSTLVYSLGIFRGLVDGDAYLNGNTSRLVKVATEQLSTGILSQNVRQIVQVLYGLSLLKHNDSGLITKLLAPFADPMILQGATETELFSIAYSLAELRTNYPVFIKRIALEICRPERARDVGNTGVAGFIHSLCRLRFGNYNIMGSLIDLALSSDSKNAVGTLDIAQIVYGLGVVGMVGHPHLEKLSKKCTDQKFLRKCTDQQVANLVSGFAGLKHMPPDLEAALLKEVGKKKRLPKFTDQGLANILHAFSRCNAGDAEWKAKVAAEATKKTRLSSSTSQGLSNILYSFRLWRYDGDAVTKLLKEVVKESRLAQHDSHTLSSILYSLSAMNYSDIQMLNLIVTEIIKPEKLGGLNSQGVSNVIVALSNMGVRDKVVWNLLAIEASKPSRLTSFTEQGLVQIVHALQHVKFQNDSLLAAIGREILVPERLGDYSPESLAGTLIILAQSDFSWRWMDMGSVRNVLNEVTKPTRVHGFSERGLCSILKAIRLLNLKAPLVVRTLVDEAMSDRIFPNLHDRGLCSILVSISKLELNDHDVTTKICKRLVDNENIIQLRPQDISIIVDSLYWMGFYPADCMQTILDKVVAEDFVPHYTENELVLLLRGLGGLGVGDQTIAAVLLGELCRTERSGRLSGKQIATVVDACLQLRVDEEDKIRIMLDMHPDVLRTTGTHHLSKIIIGLGKFGDCFQDYMDQFIMELSSKTRLSDIVDADLTNLVNWLKGANFPNISKLEGERMNRSKRGKLDDAESGLMSFIQTLEQASPDNTDAIEVSKA